MRGSNILRTRAVRGGQNNEIQFYWVAVDDGAASFFTYGLHGARHGGLDFIDPLDGFAVRATGGRGNTGVIRRRLETDGDVVALEIRNVDPVDKSHGHPSRTRFRGGPTVCLARHGARPAARRMVLGERGE